MLKVNWPTEVVSFQNNIAQVQNLLNWYALTLCTPTASNGKDVCLLDSWH